MEARGWTDARTAEDFSAAIERLRGIADCSGGRVPMEAAEEVLGCASAYDGVLRAIGIVLCASGKTPGGEGGKGEKGGTDGKDASANRQQSQPSQPSKPRQPSRSINQIKTSRSVHPVHPVHPTNPTNTIQGRQSRVQCRSLTKDEEEGAFRSIAEAEAKVRRLFNRFLFAPSMYAGMLSRLASKRERFDHVVGGEFRGRRDEYVASIPSIRASVEAAEDRMRSALSSGEGVEEARAAMGDALSALAFKQDAVERMCDEAYATVYLPYLSGNIPELSGISRECIEASFGMPPAEFARSFSEMMSALESGRRARSAIMESNQRLVVFVAKKYVGRGVPFHDLVQEGNIGLVNAVRKFNAGRGNKFSTYAIWWIRQSVARSVDNKSRTIRVPVHIVEMIDRMKRAERGLAQKLSRKASDAEVAESMGIDAERVRQLRRSSMGTVSLDDRVGEDDATYMDFVADENAVDPGETADTNMAREKLLEMLGCLPESERAVMDARYGISDGIPKTLEEVGAVFRVTRERVRQIEASALEMMRAHPNASALKEFFDR